jgi:hypothetical protein
MLPAKETVSQQIFQTGRIFNRLYKLYSTLEDFASYYFANRTYNELSYLLFKQSMIRLNRTTKILSRSFPSAQCLVINRYLTDQPIIPIQRIKYDNLIELHDVATKTYTTNPMFGTVVGDKYEWISFQDFDKEVTKCRYLLKQNHIGMDDKVALISNNRTEWAVTNYATVGLGAAIVPM